MLPWPSNVLSILAIAIAGVTSGLTGFGFGLVAGPLLVLLLPVRTVVPMQTILSWIMALSVLYEVHTWINVRDVLPLLVAGILGVPGGTLLLLLLDARTLKLLIAAVSIAGALAMGSGLRWRRQSSRADMVGVGLLSGLLSGSIGMGGPPVVLFFSNEALPKQAFRATLSSFFLTIGAVSLLGQAVSGLVNASVLSGAAMLFLPAWFGNLLGRLLAHKVDEELFRRIALLVLAATSVIVVLSSL